MNCLVKIIHERIIAAVQFEIKLFVFFLYRSKQLTGYIYTDIYCKLSKCIAETPCSYEHYLVLFSFRFFSLKLPVYVLVKRRAIIFIFVFVLITKSIYVLCVVSAIFI